MNVKRILVLCLFISFLFSCSSEVQNTDPPKIIPAPNNIVLGKGKFLLNSNTKVTYPDEFKISGEFLVDFIKPKDNENQEKNNTIGFIKDPTLEHNEGYSLDIQPKRITIKAKTDQGAFYAVQSLRQLLPVEFETKSTVDDVFIPCVTIEDAPRFQYRGMHLDVSRHMFPVEFIKKYIDALAMLKLNTFHWHLTDDQGWRIEIKAFPKLQEVAAFRKETLIGHYSDQPHQFDHTVYGGFYTQEEIKDIVNYASKRHITIIPEIEMPGHAQAAIAAYPELGCTGKAIDVATKWGVFEDIYCPKENTFTFLETVLDEVMTLFPGQYIHIGGDEAPKVRWKNCKHCQDLMANENLKDENELQSYFISRIENYLNSKGRQIIGWDEILEGGLAPNATVMSWRSTTSAIEAAKQKHDVILTPTSHCYFDYYQSTNPTEPIAIGGFLPLEKVYGFDPVSEEMSKEESKYVLGAQGNLWTEYISTEKQLEYMAFPRMLALSEVIWTQPNHKDYNDFVLRLEHFNKRLDALNINYANHLYDIEGDLVSNNGQLSYTLKTLTSGKQIRYTLDGSIPNFRSTVYKTPIPIDSSITITAAVFDSETQLGKVFSETINYHKAVGKTIQINETPNEAYSGSGASGLINGISGSDKRYGDKEWLGFWGKDIEIQIDFGDAIEVESIKTRFHNGHGQWIYTPREVAFDFTLDDGSHVTDVIHLNPDNEILVDLNYEFKTPKSLEVKVKSVTLKIPNYGMIPEGKQGAGHKAWTFIDEIIIN
ncbi:beta-N-acetylhexosaminidase [Psychroserpens sp. XS_ASV72]|uniref:beta-N-acetylhexosaminidase n=1 Tax=Psychroserpens sp. XS_ASV72 TaxID=3241293 RepID=UPI003517D057